LSILLVGAQNLEGRCPMNSGRNLGLVLLACLVLTAVSSQAQTNFYWTNNAGGAWSTSASWTNGLPIAGGSSDYSLIFQNTSAVITTNDIGTPGYILNK
ncbi:MAG: hypothetical protein NTY53_25595, partial [Kiritimatiellaeota bacterium]|nr:hypothetical protein [Kiritimatiellota bacterium]